VEATHALASEPQHDQGLDARVILLGRTGFESALRTDPRIELIRVSDPMEAIGELGHPDALTRPAPSVVVVGSNFASLAGEHGSMFVEQLRIVNPGVVVLGVSPGDECAYDGVVSPDAKVDQLRAAMRWRPGQATPAAIRVNHQPPPAPTLSPGGTLAEMVDGLLPLDEPEPGTGTRDAREAREARDTRAEPDVKPGGFGAARPRDLRAHGDESLCTLMLRGQDPLSACVLLIRERTGDHTIEFAAPVADATPEGVPVVWEGACFGHLKAAKTEPGVLATHARWLASWLRLRDQQNQLRAAAFTDPLTGAWNRRYFDRFIASAIEQARANRQPVTVLVFDIDNFKQYNDQYGHDAGDDILRETVRLLRSTIRPTDRVCRVGGDEFAVVFFEPQGPRQEGSKHPSSVFAIAQRFQQQVLKHQFPKLLNCAPGTLTISGGLATFPWDGNTPAELLGKADQLAMASKRQGKNAITIGPGAMKMMNE
jgi:diguanylate cyclase (GGDEF)-like protein